MRYKGELGLYGFYSVCPAQLNIVDSGTEPGGPGGALPPSQRIVPPSAPPKNPFEIFL